MTNPAAPAPAGLRRRRPHHPRPAAQPRAPTRPTAPSSGRTAVARVRRHGRRRGGAGRRHHGRSPTRADRGWSARPTSHAFEVEQRERQRRRRPSCTTWSVKRVGGRWTLLASYWDGGFVQVDVDDPARPRLIRRHRLPRRRPAARGARARDRRRGQRSPGRVQPHQPLVPGRRRGLRALPPVRPDHHRPRRRALRSRACRERRPRQSAPAGQERRTRTTPRAHRPRTRRLSGAARSSPGLACGPASVPGGRGRGRRDRGGRARRVHCSPRRPAVAAAGYEGMIIFNRAGPEGGCDAVGGIVIDTTDPRAVRVPHRRLSHPRSSTTRRRYTLQRPGRGAQSTRGRRRSERCGEGIGVRATFDGWGYLHLYERRSGARGRHLRASPSRRARATPPTTATSRCTRWPPIPTLDLAYVSYYAGGLRVVAFGPRGLREVGRYIGPRGQRLLGRGGAQRDPDGRKLRAGQRPRQRPVDLPLHRAASLSARGA